MSTRAARLVFGSSLLFAGFTIWGVHYMQQQERETMYRGVLKDEARVAEKRRRREEEFRESARKQEAYVALQPVLSTTPVTQE